MSTPRPGAVQARRPEPDPSGAPAEVREVPATACYRIDHETLYDYESAVTQSWQRAHLTPQVLPWQQVLTHRIDVEPPPDERHEARDAFGNRVLQFALHRPHRRLRVRMQAELRVGSRSWLARAADPAWRDVPWEAVRDAIRAGPPAAVSGAVTAASAAGPLALASGEGIASLWPARMAEPSPLVPLLDGARRYAAAALRPGRPWLEAVKALMHAIHRDFEFDPQATHSGTPVVEVLQHRRGVCQDFAHVMLAALRSHGLAARYVSGYLLTDPPPGQPRLLGADASHAWVAVFHPQLGWVEFDPTNDRCADARHPTLGWGGDFADVVPLRGVILGGGAQGLAVSVSVVPTDRVVDSPIAASAR